MRESDVQGIEIEVAAGDVFAYLADAGRLPEWTEAFASAGNGRAVMRTPRGEVGVELAVEASAERGTVDWRMGFPDGSVATAFSRVVPLGPGRSVYSFVLTAPPVPLEELEGALEAQSRTLAGELVRLKELLEGDD